RLKILAPRHWKHPSKEFLKQWYSRLGYVQQSIEPFELMPPEFISELATECDFSVWHKSLG
ncbi:MAG TPA: N-acetyltransferase, partial [Acidobacteriota bacterium]